MYVNISTNTVLNIELIQIWFFNVNYLFLLYYNHYYIIIDYIIETHFFTSCRSQSQLGWYPKKYNQCWNK